MSDLKLYEVTCSVELIVEIEAASENDSKELAKQQLIHNGIYEMLKPVTEHIVNKFKCKEKENE